MTFNFSLNIQGNLSKNMLSNSQYRKDIFQINSYQLDRMNIIVFAENHIP